MQEELHVGGPISLMFRFGPSKYWVVTSFYHLYFRSDALGFHQSTRQGKPVNDLILICPNVIYFTDFMNTKESNVAENQI